MSERQRTETESKITTDRETIHGWADDHDAVPARYVGAEDESGRLRIIPETKRDDRYEELTWDDFFAELEETNSTVVYHGADRSDPFEVIVRDEVLGRTTVENDVVEDALMEGETVTSQVTETMVVEQTIVEEATIESEVVDRETLEEEIVDAELLARDAVDCELIEGEAGASGERIDLARFEVGTRIDEEFEVEIEVDESWSLTKEVLEELTIESRVVDTNVTETDTVESDTVEASIDVEGVQRTILEGDLLDADAAAGEIVESGAVESERTNDDVFETRLAERKTVEEEVSLRRRFTGDVYEGETLGTETVRREAIEGEIVDREDPDVVPAASDSEPEMEQEVEPEVEGEVEQNTGAEAPTGMEGTRVAPSGDDEGKTVVDAGGERIGMVAAVEGETMYVDPHPSLTDRIKVALDWGEMDEEAYPVDAQRISRISDDRVELAVGE